MQNNESQNMANGLQSKITRHFAIEQGVFLLLMAISLFGIVIISFSKKDGYAYWLFMVLVFGILSIFVSKLQSQTNDNDFANIVKEQGLHWLHTLLVVIVSSLLHKSGQLSDEGASLVILLLLALATMLDGMRIGWQFTVLGFFLAASTIVIAFIESFMWACVGLAIVVAAGTYYWERKQCNTKALNADPLQR